MRPLHPHQAEAIRRLRAALLAGAAAPMVQAPTGAGKTRVAAEIVSGALAKGKRVLIVVPALSLVDQTVASLEDEGIRDIGVMQALHERTDSAAAVQVASVQTLGRRKLPACDLVLIDEAHGWFTFFEKMIAERKAVGVPVIGLSATPWTKGLGKHYDDLLQVTTTAELIDLGLLSQFRVYAPTHPNLDKVRTVAGDFHEGQLAAAMNKPKLVADVVATWLQRGERRPTLCFAVDRAHAKHLEQQFAAVGVHTGYIDSHTTREERAKVRHGFHTGEVVCNVCCLTTGVDWDVRCIVLARPTKSEMLFVQVIGRGLRAAPGKKDCLILDHSDTTLRLGFVTEINHDRLDSGSKQTTSKKRDRAVPVECPSCHFLRPPNVSTCPACGFRPQRQNAVVVEDGDLVEIGDRRRRLSAPIAQRVNILGQFRSIARRKGYASGWADHAYRGFFGGWPTRLPFAPDVEPTAEILSWIKSRQIAFAKGRGGANARRAS